VARCQYFEKLFASPDDASDVPTPTSTNGNQALSSIKITLPRDNTTTLFRQLLQFIYTDSCDALCVGTKVERLLGPPRTGRTSNTDDRKSNIWDSVGEGVAERNEANSAFENIERKRSNNQQAGRNKDKKIRTHQANKMVSKKHASVANVSVESEALADPVLLLQDLAREFGVKNLAKRFVRIHLNGSVISSIFLFCF